MTCFAQGLQARRPSHPSAVRVQISVNFYDYFLSRAALTVAHCAHEGGQSACRGGRSPLQLHHEVRALPLQPQTDTAADMPRHSLLRKPFKQPALFSSIISAPAGPPEQKWSYLGNGLPEHIDTIDRSQNISNLLMLLFPMPAIKCGFPFEKSGKHGLLVDLQIALKRSTQHQAAKKKK